MFLKKERKSGLFSSLLPGGKPRVMLLRGKDITNRPAWYYISIDQAKREAFRREHGRHTMKLSQYGTVIESGYGDEPPLDIKKRMELEYGFREGNSF